MRAVAEKNAESFVFRLRRQDTPTGVSNVTVQRLTELTGLTRTEVVHLALKEMATQQFNLEILREPKTLNH